MGRLNLKRFQVLMCFVWFLVYLVAVTQSYPVFLNYNPKWRCGNEGDFGHNCSILAECTDENLTFSAPFYSATEEFRLLCGGSAYVGTLMTTLLFVGVLVGAVGAGWAGDVWGRKWVGIASLSLGSFSFFASALSPSWQVLTLCRVVSGISSGGSLAVLCGLVNESLAPEQRYFLRGIWSWGWARMLMVGACYYLYNWRHFFVAQGIAVFLPILIVLFVIPESPKFLTTQNRFAELEKALRWIAKINGESYTEALRIRGETEAVDSQETVPTGKGSSWTIRDLFSSKIQTQYTLLMWLMWFTMSISGWTNELNTGALAGDFYLNQFLYSLLFALCKIAIFTFDTFVPSFTRRMLHQGSQSVVVIGYLLIISLMVASESATESKDQLGVAITVICLIATQFIEFGWDACYICVVEVFPTIVRTTGIGTSSMWARVGAMIAPQMIYLRNFWEPAPYATVVAVGLISLVASYKYLPETKGIELKASLPQDPTSPVLQKERSGNSDEKLEMMTNPVI